MFCVELRYLSLFWPCNSIQSSLLEGESSFIWSKLILNFQMPSLFCISGYSAGFSFPSNDTKKFIVKKIKRLLMPYVAWESLYYLVVCIVPSDYKVFGGISFIKEFFVSDFWFLRVLFIYYVVLWIYNILCSLLHIKNKLAQSLLLLSGCAIVWLLTKIKLINGSLSVWYYAWFFIGLLFFIYKSYINSLIQNTKKASCVWSGLVSSSISGSSSARTQRATICLRQSSAVNFPLSGSLAMILTILSMMLRTAHCMYSIRHLQIRKRRSSSAVDWVNISIMIWTLPSPLCWKSASKFYNYYYRPSGSCHSD